jgi:hypothetical protein
MKNSLTDEPKLCFMPKKQQGGKILKKKGWIFYFIKKLKNFFVSSLLMPDFV